MAEIKTLDCGCEVIVATNGSIMLAYCPLHKSAPRLYKALEAIITAEDEGFEGLGCGRSQNARQALAKAVEE